MSERLSALLDEVVFTRVQANAFITGPLSIPYEPLALPQN
jgi:hypothetical protein